MNIRIFFQKIFSKNSYEEADYLSEYLLNSKPAQKIELFKKIAEKANEDQRQVVEKSELN